MDNCIDVLIGGTPIAKQAPLLRDKFSRPQLRVEHEVAMLMTVYDEGRKDSQLVRDYGEGGTQERRNWETGVRRGPPSTHF